MACIHCAGFLQFIRTLLETPNNTHIQGYHKITSSPPSSETDSLLNYEWHIPSSSPPSCSENTVGDNSEDWHFVNDP